MAWSTRSFYADHDDVTQASRGLVDSDPSESLERDGWTEITSVRHGDAIEALQAPFVFLHLAEFLQNQTGGSSAFSAHWCSHGCYLGLWNGRSLSFG